jgi:VanZ family protein
MSLARFPLRTVTVLVYAGFLAYQSLGGGGAWACGGDVLSVGARMPRTDFLANVVAYIPLGVLGVVAAGSRTTRRRQLAWYGLVVLGAVAAFSVAMEWLQSCQPERVSSIYDVLSNTVGGLIGVCAGLVMESLALTRSRAAVDVLVVESAAARSSQRLQVLTLAIALVWVASQTLPWTFTADVSAVRANLSFLRRWPGAALLDGWVVLGHAAAWCAIACAAHLLSARRLLALVLLGAFAGLSLGAQLLTATRRPISFEELLGLMVAACLTAPLLTLEDDDARRGTAADFLFGASLLTVTAYQLRPEPGLSATSTFFWWPGVGIGGMRGALDYAMLFGWCGLATVVAAASGRRWRRLVTWPIVAVVVTLALELAQTHVPGRTGDLSAPTFTLFGVLAARACLGDLGARREQT